MTVLAMVAFAANSVLCRLALEQTSIGAAEFTAIRLASGALVLWCLVLMRGGSSIRAMMGEGSWLSACALLAYALGFSFSYVSLATGTGALLLFGAVQVTMIGHGLREGEHLRIKQWLGLSLACAGLLVLLLPGVARPPLGSALLMLGAGVAWGLYSLRGKGAGHPLNATAGNFVRAAPVALLLATFLQREITLDWTGIGYAAASGGVASGIGYAVWYSVLPSLNATTAATVQLAVPVIAALAGALFLAEPLTLRLLLAAVAVLGGIAMVVLQRAARPHA
ncbi:MAG: DMT family transporter [Pseudomonadota bacterium]|nr:DMT family transporter [Pseudomonadota bacterium]